MLRLLLTIVLATSFAATAVADVFSLVLQANGGADTALYRGEPLLVQAVLILDQQEAATIARSDGQDWTRSLSLSVRDTAGKLVLLSWASLAAAPATSLSFTPEAAEMSTVMSLAPDTLAPGDYRLEAVFSTEDTAAKGAWKGTVRAPGLLLRVNAGPRTDSAQGQAYQNLLLARWQMLNNQPEAALAQLDTGLQHQPDDIQLLSDKADVLAEMHRSDEAIATLQQAISLYGHKHPNDGHPPRWLLHRLNELEVYVVTAATTATGTGQGLQAAPSATVPPVPASSSADAATGLRHWVGDKAVPPATGGQWAVSAQAGSQYGDADYAAMRATGAPDVPGVDDHPNAWCPAVRDTGQDWLELTFAQAAPATEVRVRQSFGPGAIVKIEAIEPGGERHTWWEGVDPYGQHGFAEDVVWFSLRVPATAYAVQQIRITLNLAAHGRWKQIDAVQLIGKGQP